MTFKDWLIDRCVRRGFGHNDASDEVDLFLAGNFGPRTARIRAVLYSEAKNLVLDLR